jgi:DNA-directed RNA polymerase subunit RPC12/RpoP
MIRFTCLQCEKMLRADDTKAGSPVKCPGCGHKLTIPDTEAEPPPPEDEEPEHPAPRKKRRPRFRAKNSEATRGKVLVIFICCVVLGMHLVGLLWSLATANPVASAKQQTHELYQQMGKDLPKDVEQKWEQDFDKSMGGKEMEAPRRRSRMINLMWNLGIFCLMAVLLTFLYLRHNWARVVLGVLFLISVGLGCFGIVTGALAVRLVTAGVPVLAMLEMLVRLGVNFSIGWTLMKSRSIAAYTSGR